MPLQRWAAGSQRGIVRGTRSRPYMRSADSQLEQRQRHGVVASQLFMASSDGKPRSLIARPVGWWTRPYTPSARATAPPASAGAIERDGRVAGSRVPAPSRWVRAASRSW